VLLWLAEKKLRYVLLRLAEKPAVNFLKLAVNQKKIRLRAMMVKKAAKSDRSGNQWEVFVIIRLRGLGLVRLVHRFQAFSQTRIFIKLSLPSAWNFHKMLQY